MPDVFAFFLIVECLFNKLNPMIWVPNLQMFAHNLSITFSSGRKSSASVPTVLYVELKQWQQQHRESRQVGQFDNNAAVFTYRLEAHKHPITSFSSFVFYSR